MLGGRIKEIRKIIESFTKVIQGPKEACMDFLQILTSALNRAIPIIFWHQEIL